MNIDIYKIQRIINRFGFRQLLFENENLLNIIFYNTTNENSMIYVFSSDKNNTIHFIDVGNIAIGSDHMPHLGCFTIIEEITEESIKAAIRIVDESTKLGNGIYIYNHSNCEAVISDYTTQNNYTPL